MNNNLQNKLSSFEAAAAPEGVWEKIAEALDTEQVFSQRLYDYQETPKTNIWEKIEAFLKESTPAKVIPFITRYRKPIRYLAAASIIAVLLVSATLLLKRTEAGSVTSAEEKTIPVKEAIVQDAIVPTINPNNRTETASLQNNNQNIVYQADTKQKRILSFIKPQSLLSAIVMRGRFVPEEVDKKEMFSFSSLNDYMVYSDEDGNAMKLPKKLFSLVNCPDGDGSCKERIDMMQQKLSSTAMSADFTGVLEMLRQLQ